MAKMKSLFKTVIITEAGKKRTCKHDKTHSIQKGEYVLIIKEGLYEKPYCKKCAKIIIKQAKDILDDLEQKTL